MSFPTFKNIDAKKSNKILFDNKANDLQQLRNVITQATQIVESYFVYFNTQTSELKQKQFLSEELLIRGLHKFHKQEELKTKILLDGNTYRDISYLEANRQLLRRVMYSAGFFGIQSEWWHFNACNKIYAKENFKRIP